jgi:hypothetical protein
MTNGWFSVEDRRIGLPTAYCLLRADVLEARHALPVDFDLFQEHRLGADPEFAVAVVRAVHDEFFPGLAVLGHAEDEVLFAFVMSVTSGLHDGSILALFGIEPDYQTRIVVPGRFFWSISIGSLQNRFKGP